MTGLRGTGRLLVATFLNSRLAWWRWSPNRFQPYNHTLPDRYPWLFCFTREMLGDGPERHILSFGCSTGAEVFSLRRYFPAAQLMGMDVDPLNIARCRARARRQDASGINFATASTTETERTGTYDAIFCLSVLCHGDLTTSGVEHCDGFLRFEMFERMVTDFARCLKPRGLLLLLNTNFRFGDTAIAKDFDVVLRADSGQLGPDVLFDRNNALMKGVRYYDVAFCKH
jgi:2-polyprenyl-3-methyl-5-hydroxy-6-metoxy-1,4-benzoquinol methylase